MTTPTVIRISTPLNGLVGLVITVQTPTGFSTHFQVYERGNLTAYRYGMAWSSEQPAIDQYNRWCDAQKYYLQHEREYHNHHARNARLAAIVTNYIKARKLDGWDHDVAKTEAHFFYNIG
jgi:hypothetical protein